MSHIVPQRETPWPFPIFVIFSVSLLAWECLHWSSTANHQSGKHCNDGMLGKFSSKESGSVPAPWWLKVPGKKSLHKTSSRGFCLFRTLHESYVSDIFIEFLDSDLRCATCHTSARPLKIVSCSMPLRRMVVLSAPPFFWGKVQTRKRVDSGFFLR